MINIIIALNASKSRENLSLLLANSGNYNILPYVVSGADVIKTAINYGGKGVVICPEMLTDMYYTELSHLLPDNYKILLIKKSGKIFYEANGNMAMLILPFRASDLLSSIDALTLNLLPKKPQSKINKKIVEEAKIILMERNGMTEPQAHRFIQKRSMDTRTDINAVSEEIIKLFKK